MNIVTNVKEVERTIKEEVTTYSIEGLSAEDMQFFAEVFYRVGGNHRGAYVYFELAKAGFLAKDLKSGGTILVK